MYVIDAFLGENTPNARAICMELNMNQGKTRMISGSTRAKKKELHGFFFLVQRPKNYNNLISV